MRAAFCTTILVLLLNGCATLNQTESVRANNSDSRIDWNDNYQVVYQKITQATEHCLKPGASAGYKVDGDISHDAKEGKISVTLKSLDGDPAETFIIKIKQNTSPDKASVMVYAQHSNWKKIVTTWVKVLSRGSLSCLRA